jgi:hypothetical protein
VLAIISRARSRQSGVCLIDASLTGAGRVPGRYRIVATRGIPPGMRSPRIRSASDEPVSGIVWGNGEDDRDHRGQADRPD